jgi:hypothetical protein
MANALSKDAEGDVDMETPDPAPAVKRRHGRPPRNPSSMIETQCSSVSFQGLTFQGRIAIQESTQCPLHLHHT